MIIDCPVCKSRIKTRRDYIPPGRHYFFCPSCDNELTFACPEENVQQITAEPVQPGKGINYHYDKSLSGVTRNFEDTTQIIIPHKTHPVRQEENPVTGKENGDFSGDIAGKTAPKAGKTGRKILAVLFLAALAAIILLNLFQAEKETEPAGEIEKARSAKTLADNDNAAAYSVTTYYEAEKLHNEARELIRKEKYNKAKIKLIEAAGKYDDAAVSARNYIKKKRAEAKNSIDVFVKEWETYGKDKTIAASVRKLEKEDAGKYGETKKAVERMMKEAADICDADPEGAKTKINEVTSKFADLKAMSAPKEKREEENIVRESPKEKTSEYSSGDHYSGSEDEEIKNTVLRYHNHILNGRPDEAFNMWASERRPKVNKDLIVEISKETQYYKFRKIEVTSRERNSCEALVRVIHKKAGKTEECWESNFKMIKEYGEWKIWTTPGKKIW